MTSNVANNNYGDKKIGKKIFIFGSCVEGHTTNQQTNQLTITHKIDFERQKFNLMDSQKQFFGLSDEGI